ncbi:MAG TPA: phage tail sheath subtilisin-like domain-containing protein [Pyrinomonadaceae bacterium]|jgi:hypothetical protein
MPEYLAPGVYVEETSFRSKSIEGVSTTTTGFIGPTRYGPLDLEPDIVTSLGDFALVYGDGEQLDFEDVGLMHNYTWHAVRAFFEEGGKRLYVVRTFLEGADDGIARAQVPTGTTEDPNADAEDLIEERFPDAIHVRARFPGQMGNRRVRFTLSLSQNVLSFQDGEPSVGALQDNDVVWISDQTSPISSPPGAGKLYRATKTYDTLKKKDSWSFSDLATSPSELLLGGQNASPPSDLFNGDQIRIVSLTVTVFPVETKGGVAGVPGVWGGLALDPSHTQFGAPDSFTAKFGDPPTSRALARTLPISISLGANITNGLEVIAALNQASIAEGNVDGFLSALADEEASEADRSFEITLEGGNDGNRPTATEYEGTDDPNQSFKTGLKAFEDIEDISIIAAPGSSFGGETPGYQTNTATIQNLLISHASRMRYRIAVLDSADGQSIAQVRAMRAKMDSTYAALYYPWVRILDPITRQEIYLPPSGFISGIYARNDVNRAVYKAPANEVINLALGFETMISRGQQEVLNPEGINCLRFFEGRGFRVWGARTISSDPEWKYVNLRRYFAYLEHSIDRGTQWAVFEPNGSALWANVRLTIQDFLFNEWFNGALLGDKPDQAYFVRCDRTTMTQNDLDNGRLVCLIGVAPLRPAEFVIFRIGQWTADRKA